MTDLRIARDLALPIDIVTQAIAILARKGAGKTYTAKKLVELVIGAKVPVVVIDPTGGWWGLRTSADGERPGLPVVIFGGDHADVPLERSAGKVIADVVLEHAGAYILDLSGFESRAAEQTFVADFLERLYRGKKRETGPLLVVVDEADMFAPQRPGPEQTRSLGALEAIVRRGRIKGLGDLLISQRAAVLNKNVLTQTEVLVVMQTTGPQDRAAIDAWIEGNGTREQLGARIADTIEKAKADDPRELRRRIQQLERDAARAPVVPEPELREVRVEVPVLNGQVEDLRAAVNGLVDAGQKLVEVATSVGDAAAVIQATGKGIVDELRNAQMTWQARPLGPGATTARDGPAPRPTAQQGVSPLATPVRRGADGRQVVAERRRWTHLRRRGARDAPPDGPQVEHRRPAGSAGYIVEEGRTIALSDAGQAMVAGELGGGAPSSGELVELWGRKLKAGARRMLGVLHNVYPDGLTRAELGERSEISPTSGTFSDYLSMLRRNGLLDESGGLLRAGEALFLGERL